MTRTICIYHAECTDGAASAAVVNRKYPDTELVPMKHGDPIPVDVSGARVFVVDFSFPADIFRQLTTKASEIYWYDHHQTALPVQHELGFGVLDLEESGASLTWKELFPEEPLPPVLSYVKDKDLWQWKLPDSRAINLTLHASDEHLDPKHTIWQDLFRKSLSDLQPMREEGLRILKRQQASIEKACTRGFDVTFEGHRAFAVNWTSEASALGEYIYQDLGYPVAIVFFYDGKHWKVSLRSNRVDVAQLAEIYGGGGHPGAAGFRMDTIQWLIPEAGATT